jgi:hypothetical protein
VRITRNDAAVLNVCIQAHERAVADTLAEARSVAGRYSRTGKFANSLTSLDVAGPAGMLTTHIGSPLVSARVKEKGGYMAARTHSTLFIAYGDSVRRPTAVRVRATPVVSVAGPKYPQFATRRARELAR